MNVLITGGNGDIAQAIRHGIASAVEHIYLIDIKHDKTEADYSKEREEDCFGFVDAEIHPITADLTKLTDTLPIGDNLDIDALKIDILINAAGITLDNQLKNMPFADIDKVINLNLISTIKLSQAVLPHMISKKWGRIISIASINGHNGCFGQTNYAASKAGLFGFSKSLALETAKYGITVNTISPGYIDTQMTAKIKPEIREKILKTIPMGRMGQPDEVASAIFFLCFATASNYITGTDIKLAGGL